ncbi:DNA replication factor Cdt1 C-terminal domain-containing protein [Aspergillus ruber CBS 135680]|uniref:DNA replication factor Cdt1 C-terminal domain-containing protein n=1 Tax=Aspergillus ruber (strain CBS 135680) TaxID=1388766 RepID=A0A017SPN2_ASPRC|nr:uncharacterized protein EURHEDRAFT_449318 [Aspergillus ruber CBS 135680]EYE98225.1 hypothetical protein EURHEDRAFT_449318 [Aspergillus ruber CBS 135680]
MPRTSSRLAATLPRGQVGIQNFARATKPGATTAPSTKLEKPAAAPPLSYSPSRKRKLVEIENVASGGGIAAPGAETKATDEQKQVEDEAATPSKTLRFNELSVSSPQLRSGHHVTRSPSVRSQLGSTRGSVSEGLPQTPSKRSRSVKYNTRSVPLSLSKSKSQPITKLHSAFLKALTLHSAHNGFIAPVDLREFLHAVGQVWRKRKIVVKDLQRLVWIWEQSQQVKAPFRLANYGLGRVCLEREWTGRIDESEWQEQFEQTLDLLWEKTLDSIPNLADDEEEKVAENFVDTLGLSPIHECLTPLTSFRKGQQRLQDLRGGVIRMKTEKLRADSAKDDDSPAPKTLLDATPNRRKSLLDRIKNKELRQSTLPPPPSKDMLVRRAAVERVEDVANVLASLRPVGYVGSGIKAMLAAQRKPFQIPTIVQHVQDSVRNPISPQEVEICIEVMARTDIAGNWVNFVTVGAAKMIVLKSCADVSPKELAVKAYSMKIGYDEESVPN